MLNQLWVGRTARFWQGLFCVLVTLFFLNGLAWGANGTNKLTAVSLDADAVMPTILVETAAPVGYRYTVYDSFEPTRVVIDFPGMELSDIPETVSVNQGAVQEIRIASFQLSSGLLARVEIVLSAATEYQVTLDDKQFRVSFTTDGDVSKVATPVTASDDVVAKSEVAVPVENMSADISQEANLLKNVSLSPDQAVLEANGRIDKFVSFALDNPPRLVIDVFGLKPAFKERAFSAEGGFKEIRVGAYDDKTRLVFDASESSLPEHQVEGRNSDILVSWNVSKPAPVAAVKSEQPVVNETASTAGSIEEIDRTEIAEPAPVPVAERPEPAKKMGPARIEAIDFINEEGRSVIAVSLSSPAQVLDPVQEDNMVRFEIVNAKISRALRRTLDASAFPGAVTSVTPYTVSAEKHQNVRIAIDLKGPVAYAMEQDDTTVRLVVDDGAYSEPVPPAVSQVEIVVPEKSEPPEQDSSDSMAEEMAAPTSAPVSADEMAAEASRYTGEKITLVFDSANVRSILQLIGDVSGLNILANSDVKGEVTLRLIDVPWDQALDLVLDTADLGKLQQGNVLRIMPKDKLREIEQTDMKEQMIEIEEGVLVTRVFSISYASVDDMKGFLSDIKSDRGSIIADSRNKQLIIRDVQGVLEEMDVMISQIDMPERQVMIEARIVEANTNFSRNLGVQWGFDYKQANDVTTKSLAVDEVKAGLGGVFSIAPVIGAGGFGSSIAIAALEDQLNIDLRLAALENSGEGKIVSTPRITTLNGETAVISQGTKIPFSSVSDSGTDVQFENAELKLQVTPEINPDGSILLDIDVSNSAVGTVVPTATGDAVSIDEKKAQTKALVRNGQTTVIGGIFIEDERDAQSGVPWLKDIPGLGYMFRSTSKTRDRRELLIFITPRIVEP